MKSIKHILFVLCISIVTTNDKLYSFDFDLGNFDQTIDTDSDNQDEFDRYFNGSEEISVDKKSLPACEPGEADAWVIFLDALNIPKLLDIPFYLRTNIPYVRNIINYPNFFMFQPLANSQLTFDFFYNQAFKKNFTNDTTNSCNTNNPCAGNGQRLGSYINIEDGGILNFLETDLPKVASKLPPDLAPLRSIHFPLVLQTLGNARLEERRVGFLMHYLHQFNPKTTLELRMPIFYQIHNLNFTPQEKLTLTNEFAAFGNNADFDEVAFGRKHFIMDAVGNGTLDFTVNHTCYESGDTKLNVGLAFYLPVDCQWATGLYGTNFKPKDIQPILPICQLVTLFPDTILNPGADDIIQNYFLSMIDHLSSAILQCPMGYNQHLALALKVVPYWQWSEHVVYSGMYIFEYICPKEESRFFITKQPVPFSTLFDQAQSNQEKVDLFEQQLTKTLFPRVFNTQVNPGFVVNTISNLQFTRHAWDYTIGYNWWYKTGEKLSHIQAPADLLKELEVKKATATSAQQVKLFGKIHRIFTTQKHSISCSFFGDITVFNTNLGNDFSLGISFDKTF